MTRSLNTGSAEPTQGAQRDSGNLQWNPNWDDAEKPPQTKAPINPHELDALYQAGTLTVVGSNSHYAGLRAVYDAGVATRKS